MEEARRLAAGGVKELVLIAQDTTYYGLDLYHKRALGELLQRLSEVDGIEWIRIHYSYPADFPEDVLDQMANNPKVCRYMDIPLQHVADKVLDMMHRHVDGAWTRALIRKMREKVPGIVLRTTMIVGHPGEGQAEFKELLDFVKDAKFERLGAFTYSEEEGTFDALNFKNDVPERTKKSRLKKLMELLGQEGIDSILLEGGAQLHESALRSGIVNKVQAYIAPKLFGGKEAPSPLGGSGVDAPDEAWLLSEPVITGLGPDLLLESEVIYPCLQES